MGISLSLERREDLLSELSRGLRTKGLALPVFGNKDLLGHSHTHVFMYIFYGCFCTAMTDLSHLR